MAIDSSLFGADLPAGTYAAGDVVQLKCVAGPANVRSGKGKGYLKSITTGFLITASGSTTLWKIEVKNSDWIDPSENITTSVNATSLDIRSGSAQFGHDCPLEENSSWSVIATCLVGGTTTVANSLFALIDVDYPSVSSIINPAQLVGYPTGIEHNLASTPYNAGGTITSSGWVVQNVDFFKAGYEYALEKVEILCGAAGVGFLAITNAAGMQGLSRIIVVDADISSIKQTIDYASKLVKGPMDIKTMMFNTAGTATTGSLFVIFDFVKRKV